MSELIGFTFLSFVGLLLASVIGSAFTRSRNQSTARAAKQRAAAEHQRIVAESRSKLEEQRRLLTGTGKVPFVD